LKGKNCKRIMSLDFYAKGLEWLRIQEKKLKDRKKDKTKW